MEQSKSLYTLEELGDDVILASRTSKLYPVKHFHSTQDVRDHLFYLSICGKIDAVFPYSYEMKASDSFLLLYTVSGAGQLSTSTDSIMLSANTVLFFHCGHDYTIELPDTADWQFYMLHFNGPAAAFYYYAFLSVNPDVEFVPLNSQIRPIPILSDNLHFLHESCSKIPSLFRNFDYEAVQSDHPEDSKQTLLISMQLTELLTELIMEKKAFRANYINLPPYLRSIKEELDASYHESWTLQSIEEKFHICKFRIVHEFTEYYGVSPICYLIGKRIQCAKEQLASTDMRINQIASNVGIDNMNHFIYLFKKEVGMTPSAYRKNVRMKQC